MAVLVTNLVLLLLINLIWFDFDTTVYNRRPGSWNDPRDPSRSVGDFLRMPRQHCSPDAWNCVMQ